MTSINFYKITSTNTDKVYVGSTKKDINDRLKQHDRDYKKYQDGKTNYITSFEILECKDYKIELLENKICESKEERNTLECNYIINTPNTVNRNLPGRTPEQYRQDNKDLIDEYQRQYRQENKDYFQQYRQENKDYYQQYRQDNKEELKERHRQYRQENKDYYQQYRQDNKDYFRQYRQDNKEELNRKAKEKHNCPCGGKYTKKHKSIHEKTQKHQTYHIHIHIHNN